MKSIYGAPATGVPIDEAEARRIRGGEAYSAEMMRTYYAHKALHGMDENFADYIRFSERYTITTATSEAKKECEVSSESLKDSIINGLSEKAGEITRAMLDDRDPLDIVSEEIIPSLDTVGKGFEKKTVYLPQLLMSAEAAKAAFTQINKKLTTNGSEKRKARSSFVIATVHGDIHDIGKNIVKLLLENYGFDVTDMGKDVPAEKIAEKVKELRAPMVGLSALMTTTVPAMEETIKLIRKTSPETKIIVGGAVLTEEYAKAIGADYYAPDAMAAVRFAEEIDT